ncbi:MAG: ATP-binding protein [PVC group bacterium]
MTPTSESPAAGFSSLPASLQVKSRRFFGLGAKLTILVLSSLLCISVITTIISIRHLRDALNTGVEEMGRTMGRVLGISSAYQGFFDIDNRLLKQYVTSAVDQKNVVYAVITKKNGEVVQTGLSAEQLEHLQKGDPPLDPEIVHQEIQDITMESPIGKIGTIYLGISKEEVAAVEKKLILVQVISAGAITAIFLVILWIIIHSITRPLRQLTEKTKEMGEGKLDKPLEVTGRDEVGRLASSIEIMRGNLNRKIQTIAFLGRIAHDFNAVFDLNQTIDDIKKELINFPLWPWHEMGIALIGRGGKTYTKTQFNYYHVIPASDREGNRFSIFSLKDTMVAEIVYQKQLIVRDLPTSLSSSQDGFSLYLKDRDISSSVAFPLLIKNKVLGMLYAGFQDRSGRLPEIQKICQNIADELARAIEGIYLLYDLRLSLDDLKSAHQQLKGLDNLKSEFISSVSHELRTPLVSMTGYLHMMLDEKLGSITELQREGLEVSVKSLQRLTNLIQKMLSFSSEQKEKELDLSDFKIKDLLEHCATTLKAVADKQQVKIKTFADDNLPPVRADEDKIIQVLINLTDNAIKFSPQGARIDLKARRADGAAGQKDMIEVIVRDEGKGLSPKDQTMMFEKFWQGSKEDGARQKGLGLGLALVKKILDQHGCSISVVSELGRGTTITFTLPTVAD